MTLHGVRRVSRASCSSRGTDNNHSSLFSSPFFPPVCVHVIKCNLPLSSTSRRSQLSNVCCQFSSLLCSPHQTVAGSLLFTKQQWQRLPDCRTPKPCQVINQNAGLFAKAAGVPGQSFSHVSAWALIQSAECALPDRGLSVLQNISYPFFTAFSESLRQRPNTAQPEQRGWTWARTQKPVGEQISTMSTSRTQNKTMDKAGTELS